MTVWTSVLLACCRERFVEVLAASWDLRSSISRSLESRFGCELVRLVVGSVDTGHAKPGREMEWFVGDGDGDGDLEEVGDDAMDSGEAGRCTCCGAGAGAGAGTVAGCGGCFLDKVLFDGSLALGISLLADNPFVALDSASSAWVTFESLLFFCLVETLSFLQREISKSSAMYMVMFSVKSDGADKLSSWKLVSSIWSS